jgi:hypothetical protein
MTQPRRRLPRILVAAGAVVVLLGSLAAPASAAGPAAASSIGLRQPTVTTRAHVNAREASRTAADQTRPHMSHRLPSPVAGRLHPMDRGPAPRISVSGAPGADAPAFVSGFDGIGMQADGLGLEPPDPWTAASASYLVHSTNGLVRVTNRAGQRLLSLPTWALFSLGPDEWDSDPRIEWDPAHNRWVGVILSWIPDADEVVASWLNVAISDGADPTAGWNVVSYGYWLDNDATVATLPDYPGIATSSDKIVLTANEFDSSLTSYIGASILVLRWSDVLAGVTPVPAMSTFPDPALTVIRPARVQGTSNDVHLVAENVTFADAGHIMYARINGTTLSDWTDLTTSGNNLDPLCAVSPPRQPGPPSTIADAIDERITDAVWRSNVLAFVSTCSDLSGNDIVRVTQLTTNTGINPSTRNDATFGIDGSDLFMGGIGFSRDGTLFAAYTQSSPTDAPSTMARSYNGAWSPAITVRAGTSSYIGTRWGDYVGVAQDPAGTAAVWVGDEVADADGLWVTTVGRLVLDLVAPTVTSAPNQALIVNTTLGVQTVPVKISWATSDPGSGVVRTVLGLDQFGTGMFDAGSPTGTSVTRAHWWKPSTSGAVLGYRYAIEAEDAYGNLSPLVLGSNLTATVYQTSSGVTYTGTWRTASASAYSGGSTRYSTSVGSSATFRTTGRSYGVVSTRASTRGKVKVYVDGTLKGTVTLTASRATYRRLVYVSSFAASATHTIKLVVASGRVDLDAFVVLR